MGSLQAIIFGIIQGLTEFLPVSSSGHLAVGQRLLARFDTALPAPDDPAMIAFDLAVHVGTLIPIVLVFRKDFAMFVAGLLRFNRYAWKFALLGVAATFATALVAYPVKDFIKQQFDAPLVIACCWIATGILLAGSDRTGRRTKGLKQFTFQMALVIGLAQACATLPGISRSGTTIAVALLLGLRWRRAAQFSFLLAFPAILAGSASEFKDLIDAGYTVDGLHLAIGFVVAALVGWLALIWLLAALRKARLTYFSVYLWILAVATIAAVSTGHL